MAPKSCHTIYENIYTSFLRKEFTDLKIGIYQQSFISEINPSTKMLGHGTIKYI